MKALVTGGAGFIGSNIVDKLVDKEFEVFVVDNLSTGKEVNLNRNAKFFNVDVTDRKNPEYVFKRVKPDLVFHLAS